MKRFLIFVSLILSICVSCVKNEVITRDADIEISYVQAITRQTKSLAANQKVLADTNIFQSYAYVLPKGTPWQYSTYEGDNGSTPYFGVDVIVQKAGTVWKDPNHTWYWPKTNTLTFFAWSLNDKTLEFPTGSPTIVNCTDQQGIVALYYDIEANKNVDFLVADIAADKTANEYSYSTYGVPTLFKHKLSSFEVTKREKEDYPGITFELDSIVFQNLANQGNYTQNPDTLACGATRSDQDYTTTTQGVDTIKTNVTDVDQYIYLPQDFDDDKTITITYTIKYDTDNDGVDDFEETVTNTHKLSDIFDDEGFRPGKKYILDLVFSMDQIYWDPAVEDWAHGSVDLNI